ncbi:hypothetical protein Nepgr_023140 [Nepenthes gracilis]|uniref:Uncharacterized protein n=1 Tax=Nepenthes gracilis TaxID=150966 RepID=A0AAD3XXM3_NEPGR|nr:hypothetical protein Nepgr_023140 [Nepenthes gracilis]
MSGTHTSGFCPPDNISVAMTANQSYCWHDLGSTLGMPTHNGNLEDQAQSVAVVHSCGDQHIEWHHDSYVEEGGVPRQCTNSEQLRRNLTNWRQKDADFGAQVADAAVPSLVNGRDTSAEGFRLKSILKKLKWPKQKRSPPSNHHF